MQGRVLVQRTLVEEDLKRQSKPAIATLMMVRLKVAIFIRNYR
jgi:hypothetical protein